jgi:predicted nucleic acid-binding protein
MIYLDTSVALAHLLAEDRAPPAKLWREPLVASRLLEHELWVRLQALDLTATHGDAARAVLERVAMLELVAPVLERAAAPFPTPVRTLDALHLASADFLRQQGATVRVASYDQRLLAAARAMGLGTYDL